MNDLLNLLATFNINLIKQVIPIFKEEGFTFNELIAMWKIMKKGSCRPADIMQGTFIPASTFTYIFDRLESRGLIVREKDPNDRRSILITGTVEMKSTIQKILEKCVKKLETAFATLPPETIESLKEDIGTANKLLDDGKGKRGCRHEQDRQ